MVSLHYFWTLLFFTTNRKHLLFTRYNILKIIISRWNYCTIDVCHSIRITIIQYNSFSSTSIRLTFSVLKHPTPHFNHCSCINHHSAPNNPNQPARHRPVVTGQQTNIQNNCYRSIKPLFGHICISYYNVCIMCPHGYHCIK